VSPATLHAYDFVISIAAVLGISTNYASGDSGDTGLEKSIGEASTPSDSPHATSVGGTSLGVPDGHGGAVQVGWGSIQNTLNFDTFLKDPPNRAFFLGGSGGGESIVFPKPFYQRKLPGQGRQQPDISAVGDPFTGGVVVETVAGGSPQFEVIGGTVDSDLFGDLGPRQSESRTFAGERCTSGLAHAVISGSRRTACLYELDQPERSRCRRQRLDVLFGGGSNGAGVAEPGFL